MGAGRLRIFAERGGREDSLAVSLEDGGVRSFAELLQLDVGLQLAERRVALQREREQVEEDLWRE